MVRRRKTFKHFAAEGILKRRGQRFQRADVRHGWTIMQNAYEEVFWLKWATLVPDASGVVRENFSQSDGCSDVYRC